MSLSIHVENDNTHFKPEDIIRGHIAWDENEAPKWLELYLVWYTSGKGDSDSETVWEQRFENLRHRGEESFSLTLPKRPYSFSGQLISICWCLQLAGEGVDEEVDYEFTMSPFETEPGPEA